MNKKQIYLLFAFISIFAIATMHYYHNSFAHDSFGYLQNARYIAGESTVFDNARVNLTSLFLVPFYWDIKLLYFFYAILVFVTLLIIVKIVEFFEPKNQEYLLFFIIPSYLVYVLTTILQECFALFFIALAIYNLLKKRYILAMALITTSALFRPAMLTFLPGFTLSLLFYKYIYNNIDVQHFFSSVYVSVKKNIISILLYGLFCIFIFVVTTFFYYILMRIWFANPFVSYLALSSTWLLDWKFIIGYPIFWFSLYGILFFPVVLYSYYKIYNLDKRWFLFFALMFFVYLLLIWYQANIRYVIYLIIPLMIGFSQIDFSRFDNITKFLLLLLLIISTLYPFGPLVYYFDFQERHRVIDLSFKPFIWFDSEYKFNEYNYFCKIADDKNLGLDDIVDYGFSKRYCQT